MFQSDFEFILPKGYLDGEGNLYRKGIMRLAKATDEIEPLQDPRVQANPAYATVIILSRVVSRLGLIEEVTPEIIEDLYAADLNYLYDLYQEINAPARTSAVQADSSDFESSEASSQP